MLSVERKKTDKVDLIKPIQKYISTQYNEKAAADHNEALNTLQLLREDIRNAQDKSDAVKELLLKYYTMLRSVELRFPVSENNIRLPFYWIDTFKNKKINLHSIYFERACVLFNYAAVLSQLGSLQNRNSADGLKLAAAYFQSSAGAFADLKDYVAHHPECSNSSDLSSEALSMFSTFMLGQAQACFVEKAIKDGMKDGIVAKLAGNAAESFETATSLLNGALKNTDRIWAGHVEVWCYIFKAIVQQKMATPAQEAMKYGEQVARLSLADRYLGEARKRLNKSAPPELKEYLDRISAVLTRAKQVAEKENDSIYHDLVPQESQLAAVEKKALVKYVPVVEAQIADPFASLVPYAIKEAAAKYREIKDQMVRGEIQNLDDHYEIAKATLTSMNLPGSIEALETPSGLPPALTDKCNTVKTENGPSLIPDLMETLRKLAEEDAALLKAAITSLDREEEEDNAMRVTYGNRWTRTPSHTLTSALRQEAAKYRGHIEHATKSDSFINTKWRDHHDTLVLLAGPKEDILARLPTARTGAFADTAPLKKVLADLDSLIASREAAKAELSALSAKDDISTKLLGGRAHEEVFAEELKKYDTILNKMRENCIRQEQLLSQVAIENDIFVTSKKDQDSASGGKREEVLTQLNSAFKAYNEMKAGLREGIQFYTNLQEILNQFKSKCDDFVLARSTEKTDLLAQVSAPQAPPPSAPAQPTMPGAWQPYMQPLYAVPPPGYPYGAPQQPPPYYNSTPPPPYANTNRR